MIFKCNHCDYKKETPLNLELLEKAAEKDRPFEDFMLLMTQAVEEAGLKQYNGVKVHMGRKHKGEFMSGDAPSGEFTHLEQTVIELAQSKA